MAGADLCEGYYPVGENHLLRGRNINGEHIKVYRDTIRPKNVLRMQNLDTRVYLYTRVLLN